MSVVRACKYNFLPKKNYSKPQMKKLVHDLFFYLSQFSFYLACLLFLPFYTVFLLCDLFASNCLLLTIDLVALKLQKILETRKLQFTLFNPYFHICLNCQRRSEMGFCLVTRSTARRRFSPREKSHGCPSKSSRVVRSNANPGMSRKDGIILAISVTLGGE